jgi:hypothetical protein
MDRLEVSITVCKNSRCLNITWLLNDQAFVKCTYETEKNRGDLRQINQLDQHLWSGINTADAALSHRPEGTSYEAISIFLT